MIRSKSVLALTAISGLIAATPALAFSDDDSRSATAPAGTADTRYCMHIAAATGSLVERTKCWTRDEWAAQGVDVDRDWAANGVKTAG